LEQGHRIAQYEIIAPIGAGGMGEVYRARDTNLEREVALKVLPSAMAGDPQRLARLEREAKAIAALSHPNILAVHDFGTADGSAFLVTELLTGETLRERLSQGALTPRKATEYGRQIARGLAAAHDRGIVHRDLKPENLFLTGEGRVKILDFGLASAAGEEPVTEDAATLELKSGAKLTSPGTVLGTVDYMSPEQVRGEPTDARSDIFSLGSVLYEMVAGARPFRRDTSAETMTAILKEDPPELASVASDVSPALATIIRRCLEKRPGERFHSAHDLAFSLEALSGSTMSSGAAEAIRGSAPPRRVGLALTAALVLAGLVIGAAAAYLLRPQPTSSAPETFTTLSSRRGTVTNARFTGVDAGIYSASWVGDPLRLYPASPGARTAFPLNVEAADLLSVASTGELAVSLDRRHVIGWEAVGTLAVTRPGGSAPRPVLEDVLVADWSPDGQSLAVAHEVDGVVRLEYPIGTVLYESTGWISDIRVHPDGERVLIADCPVRGDNRANALVVHRDGRAETLSWGGSWGLLWAPDGESVWLSTGSSIYRVRPGHEPELMTGLPNPLRLLDVSVSGDVLAAAATIRREMIGRGPGADVELDLSWQDWSTPSILSADGELAVFEEGNDVDEDGYAVYLRRTDGSPPLYLGQGSALALSPDARWLAMLKRAFTDDALLELVPTGPGEPRPVNLRGLRILNKDGFWIAAEGEDTGSLILAARLDGGPTRLFRLPLDDVAPPVAITPADLPLGPNGHLVSADGRRVIVRPAGRAAVELSLDGDDPRPVPGLLATDLPLRLDRDGRHVYVQAAMTIPSPVYRVDMRTGERTLWLELAPRDRAGVFIVDRLRMADDGSAYIYSIRRNLSRLMLVEGLE
jgi:hypothetical protein